MSLNTVTASESGHKNGSSGLNNIKNIFSANWLVELANDPSPHGRMLLGNTVTDMLDNGNAMEREIIADILMHIVQRVELDVRRLLAERLARQSNAPHDLMVWLANDEISVARPVLVLSQVLDDNDLMTIIHARDIGYRQAVANRSVMGPQVVKALIASHDETVLQSLLKNEAIVLEESAMLQLMQAAKRNENLKQPIIARRELGGDLALELYWWVSQELRFEIQSRFNLNRAKIDEALEATLQEILGTRTFGLESITPEICYVAQQLHAARRTTSGLLITTLRRGQVNLFIALFAEVLRLPPDKISTMLSHPSGEFLAVCCRTQNIMKPDFASIYLLGRSGRSGERTVDPQELSRTLRFYDQLNFSHATMLLERWQRDESSLNLSQPDVSVAMSMLAQQ